MEKIGKICKSTADVIAIASIGLLFVVLLFLFLGGFDFYETAGYLYAYSGKIERVFLCGIAFMAFWLWYMSLGKALSFCNQKAQRILIVAASVVAILVQGYFLFYIRSCYKWDSGFVIGGATSLVETGSVAEQAYYYLSVYPNQNTFVCMTAALIKLGDCLGIAVCDRPLFWNLFNTVCMDISLVLSMAVIKKWKPGLSNRQLTRMFLMMLCNPFLYLGVSYYYTITLSLPLTMGFILLVINKGDEEKKGKNTGYGFLKWVVAGGLLGVGYQLRATAIILAIAASLTGAYAMLSHKKDACVKGMVKWVTIAISAILVASSLQYGQEKYIGIDTEDTAFPTTHWLMMSLTMPGSHNGEDEAYTASFPTKEEKQEAVRERLLQKLETMSAKDFISLAKTKVQNTFGNGTNGYGVFLAEALRTDGLYESIFGGHKDFTVLWHQGYYLFMLLGILLYTWKWLRHRKDDTGLFLLLILLGAILFYVLWEASEQYSVPFMMVMYVIALIGMNPWSEEYEETIPKVMDKFIKKGQNIAWVVGVACALLVLIWGIVRFPQYTRTEHTQSYKAAVQILANTSFLVDDNQELKQTLALKRPFNRLVIQWRNPYMEESSASYRMELREMTKDGITNTLFTSDIQAAGTGYYGAGIYDFSTIVPKEGAVYTIVLYKMSGEEAHDLEFVVYDMPGYIPYSLGELSLESNGSIQQLPASMLFSVTEEKVEAYADTKTYIFFLSLLCLLFLFEGFWCKIKAVSFTKEEH